MTARSPRIFAIHLNGAVFFGFLGIGYGVAGAGLRRGCAGSASSANFFVWRCDNLTLVIPDPFGDISIYRVAPN